jgi:hypothetical protein
MKIISIVLKMLEKVNHNGLLVIIFFLIIDIVIYIIIKKYPTIVKLLFRTGNSQSSSSEQNKTEETTEMKNNNLDIQKLIKTNTELIEEFDKWKKEYLKNKEDIGNKLLTEEQITQILDIKLTEIKNNIVGEIKKYFIEIDKVKLSEGKTLKNSDKNLESSDIKYLKTIQDKTFHTISSSYNAEDCFFRLFNEKDKNADFEFYGDVQVALANKDMLKEVCETTGTYMDATGILNIKEGKVVLQDNGTWKVIDLAKIKFTS